MISINNFTSSAKCNTIKYSLVSLLMVISTMVSAQSITVKGFVKEIDGTPMIGVEVLEKAPLMVLLQM